MKEYKYKPLPLLLYAWEIPAHQSIQWIVTPYINARLLLLGHCVECDNTRMVEVVSCYKPMSECCGGCTIKVDCTNCQ